MSMETREIFYNGKWCKVGDTVIMKKRVAFLFWYLPITIDKKYQIEFIGKDSAASVIRGNDRRTITGKVNIYRV